MIFNESWFFTWNMFAWKNVSLSFGIEIKLRNPQFAAGCSLARLKCSSGGRVSGGSNPLIPTIKIRLVRIFCFRDRMKRPSQSWIGWTNWVHSRARFGWKIDVYSNWNCLQVHRNLTRFLAKRSVHARNFHQRNDAKTNGHSRITWSECSSVRLNIKG